MANLNVNFIAFTEYKFESVIGEENSKLISHNCLFSNGRSHGICISNMNKFDQHDKLLESKLMSNHKRTYFVPTFNRKFIEKMNREDNETTDN